MSNAFWRSYTTLGRYRPLAVTAAPDQIALIRGSLNYNYLKEEIRAQREFLLRMSRRTDLGFDPQMATKELMAFDPINYDKNPQEYAGLDVMLELCFASSLRAVKGMQLASNYGPYLHYLRNERQADFCGIDLDPYAAEYAAEIGVPVSVASATSLPFPDHSFDVVISRNFLEERYLSVLFLSQADEQLRTILGEVWRVLKPRGFFISSGEVFADNQEESFPLFGRPLPLPPELFEASYLLRQTAILRKEGV